MRCIQGRGDASIPRGISRRRCLVANRATLPQKWPPQPPNVADSCEVTALESVLAIKATNTYSAHSYVWRERVLYCQHTGPNPLNHPDDVSGPALCTSGTFSQQASPIPLSGDASMSGMAASSLSNPPTPSAAPSSVSSPSLPASKQHSQVSNLNTR